MPEPLPPTPGRPDDRRRVHRLRLGFLTGLALMLLGTPAVVLVALVTGADWAVIAVLATFALGLFTVGGVTARGRSSFHAGTKIWQNDGLPGGGAGGA